MARALTLLVLAFGLLATARAEDERVDPVAIDTFLERGKKLFEDQEYAAAIQALAPVTRDARATRAQRLRALELIALAYFIGNDQGAARATSSGTSTSIPATSSATPRARPRSAPSSTT